MCIPILIFNIQIGNWALKLSRTTYAIDYGDGSAIF
jgi:hypothetical protein